LLDGRGIYHAMADPLDGTLYAATNHRVYGSTVQRSTDRGRTWRRSRQIGLPEESGLTLEAVWHIEPGRPENPNTLYLGAAPGALYGALGRVGQSCSRSGFGDSPSRGHLHWPLVGTRPD
jgi:hypothetical protein